VIPGTLGSQLSRTAESDVPIMGFHEIPGVDSDMDFAVWQWDPQREPSSDGIPGYNIGREMMGCAAPGGSHCSSPASVNKINVPV